MTQIVAIAAEARARAGKGTARQTRRGGRVPAVIYGNKEKAVMISMEEISFTRVLHAPGFFTHLYDIAVDGTTHRVLARDVQFDPVSDRPLHVDFLRVGPDTRLTLAIPVEFVNVQTCPGIKRGGMLNIVRHDIEVECGANNIPEHITVDLGERDIGDSVHISSVTLPEGVVPTISDRDFTIATIVAPSGVKSEEAAAATEQPAA